MRQLGEMLRQVFHGVIRRFEEQGVSPPRGTERVELHHNMQRDDIDIRIDFDNGWRQIVNIPFHIMYELRDLQRRGGRSAAHQLTRDVSRLYAEMYETWYAEIGVRRARDQLREAQENGDPPDRIQELTEIYYLERENVRNHQNMVDPPIFGVDLASGPDQTYITHWGGRGDGRRWRDNVVTEQLAGPESAFTIERLQEAIRILDAAPIAQRMFDYDRMRRDLYESYFYDDSATKKAKDKAFKLLKENLTKEQLACYEKNQYFEVTGGKSGTRYRIKHGRQMNIEVLDKAGIKTHGLCFLPVGGLVEGDCMLAQKNALELFEEEALKVANVIGGPPRMAPGSLNYADHFAVYGTIVVDPWRGD